MNPSLPWLAAALFTWGIGEGMFFFFQPLYLQRLGADPLMIGGILGAAGIAMTVAHIPAGYLSDRIGRRPLLVAAWLTGTTSAALMALATSLPLFVAGLILYGSTAFVVSPLNSYATAARGRWTLERTITLVSASFNLGVVIGPLTGGWIGDNLGIRTIYFISTGCFVLSTIFITFIHPQPTDHHDPDSPPAGLLSNRRYLGFLGIAFAVAFALYMPQPLTPNFLQNERALTLSQIGLLGTLGGVGNVLLSLQLGRLKVRYGYVLGQASVFLFALLIWKGTGILHYGLAYFLLGGFRAARSLSVAHIRPLIHESQMGLAFGMAETISSIPLIICPPLAGYFYEIRPDLVYPVSLGLIAAALVASFLFTPRERPATVSEAELNQPAI
jgi:MFS family permease